MKKYIPATTLILACTLTLLTYSAFAAPDATDASKVDSDALPLKELRIFSEVFGRIKHDFVEPVTDKELIQHAIRGMISGLDPHSSFLTGDEYKELKVGTSGEFGGLGLEVGMEDGFIKVITPIDDTPAQHAGIKPGDIIIRLDKKPIKGMTLNEAVNLMRGPAGSAVTLTISREGLEKPLVINMTRAIIHVSSAKGRILEPGFGYMRISQFQNKTGDEMLKEIDRLKTEGNAPLNGLILDLRNNPGGVLNAAVTVSDAFLEQGLIVYTEGRSPDAKLEFSAGPDDILAGAPIVVLINGGTASAAEIVAGALQDHKRALIVGGQSFGKGSVQTVIPIDEETALKLTTARYYTPLGRSIQAEGITPDVVLEQVQVKANDDTGASQVKESDLARHLGQDQSGGDINDVPVDATKPTAGKAKIAEALVEHDYQLNESLNILKGLSLMRQLPPVKSASKVSK